MRIKGWGAVLILVILLASGLPGHGAKQNLPLVKGKRVVATVDGEPITLDEFNQALESLKKASPEGVKIGPKAQSELLRRLINGRLIVQEAKRMGLHELPEIKEKVDGFARATLREELLERHVRDVKPDEKEVERIYKGSAQEWKVSSVLFKKEEDAMRMEERLKAGESFEALVDRFATEGKATRGDPGQYVKVKDVQPEIAGVVSKMQLGSVSPPIQIKSGFVILRLEDIRYVDDPGLKERARQEALLKKQGVALEAYDAALKKKYAQIHQDILDSIDYEGEKPGFEAYLKDQRVVAEIKGEKPITVAEMTEYLRRQFYHGVKRAAERKKLNAKKAPILQEMLYKRVLRKEALRLGIDQSESYRTKVRNYETSLIFGVFLVKAIVPDVKVKEDEIKDYYNHHIQEYTLPEMMKIQSLTFAKRSDAEDTLEKLREGADFQWIATHGEGQLDSTAPGVLLFEGKMLTTQDLPQGVQKAVSGARPGDFRLYASPEGHYYVLAIREVVSSKPQPYEDVRSAIARRVHEEKGRQALEEYADKLRAASDVKVYWKD
jgi:parvulin-like peptidyl-prolyl isomerase